MLCCTFTHSFTCFSVNGRDTRGSLDETSILSLRKELGEVRNKVNSIIDTLDIAGADHGPFDDKSQKPVEGIHECIFKWSLKHFSLSLSLSDVQFVQNPPKTIPTEEISVFDPLNPSNSVTTTSTPQLYTETTSTVPTQPTVAAVTTTTSSSSSTSHLFQGQTGSEFIDQTQSQITQDQVKTQQTGQTAIPQTSQQSGVSPPTAPPPSTSPKPPQQSAYSGYPPNQTSAYQGNYQTGQANYPTSQTSYQPPSQPGYQSSQTGQVSYQTPQTGYSSPYGSSYPGQSTAPTPVAPTGSTPYPSSSTSNPAPYAPTSYQSGSYNPPAPVATGYSQPQYPGAQNPSMGPHSFPQPAGGTGKGGVTAYGRSPYRVGY